MEPAADEDAALVKLTQMKTEFGVHKERLRERAKEVGRQVTAGELDVQALGGIVVELFLELHDTCLSFQEEIATLVHDEWEKDDEDDDDDADGADGADGVPGDDAGFDSQLLPGDAAQLRRTSSSLLGILDAMLQQPAYGPEERAKLTAQRADAQASADLVDEIELSDDAAPES